MADKGAGTVYIFDNGGKLFDNINKPESDLLSSDFAYKPSKVAVDSNGIVYVISFGCYSGALQFDAEHNFLGFYGSESVTMTAKLVLEKMWAKIVPKSMSSNQARAVPVNYNNFDIDADDMIYTTKNDVDSNVNQVRKLNQFYQNLGHIVDECHNLSLRENAAFYLQRTYINECHQTAIDNNIGNRIHQCRYSSGNDLHIT